MMMTTEPAEHRASYNSFYYIMNTSSTAEGRRRSSCSTAATDTTACGVARKRLKTGDVVAVPTKEKKDKIGERVAALQQLVSPYGKTDTASVLSEASDYIRFLHDQLQVLSAPYLQPELGTGNLQGSADYYYNLRRRGLCLMPVASTLMIAGSNGADLWAPINLSRHQ